MFRLTRYRTDPGLCEELVRGSFDALKLLRDVGVRLVPIYGRQTFKVDGKLKFLGGVTVESWGGGEGLVQQETQAAQRLGVEIAYATRALSLITAGDRVVGVRVRRNGEMQIGSGSCREGVGQYW